MRLDIRAGIHYILYNSPWNGAIGKMNVANVLMAGNFVPDTPTMLRFPTFPRLLRSKSVRPTTPTFLSDPDAPPPTKPVVYSPVPT